MRTAAFSRCVSYTLLVTAFFIGFFNRFAPATFAAPIGETLGLGAAALGGLAAMHFWVYTLMQVPAGLIVDRFGIRGPAAIGTLLTGIGALVLGMTGSYAVALSGPCLVGLGMSLVFVAMMKNNAIWFDGRRFGVVTGVTLLIGTFGSIMSEAPARLLLALTDWRTVFVALGLGTIAMACLILLFWRPPACAEGGRRPVRGTPHRSVWRDVAGSRQLWLVLLAISGTNGTFYAFAGLWGTSLLSDGYGLSGASASWILTLAWLPYGFGSLIFGHLSDWMQARKQLIWLSSLLNAAAWFWLLLVPGGGFAGGLMCFLALGLSSGAQVVVSFAAVKESVHEDLTGSAIAFVNMGVFLATAVVQTTYGWMVALGASDLAAAYRMALWLPAGLSLAGFAAALGVRETYPARPAA
ncbi:MAG: MFS transporter [Castellaniella sp.]|uniref:Lysosomal dipeptide transporter MFSD1 n=1 Tax=Castellaniella hirudinis TaxID=1144617 RepID=A0ABV8RY66_9BURK